MCAITIQSKKNYMKKKRKHIIIVIQTYNSLKSRTQATNMVNQGCNRVNLIHLLSSCAIHCIAHKKHELKSRFYVCMLCGESHDYTYTL